MAPGRQTAWFWGALIGMGGHRLAAGQLHAGRAAIPRMVRVLEGQHTPTQEE